MTKLNPLSRAVATATVALGACLLALAYPHAVMAKGTTAAHQITSDVVSD